MPDASPPPVADDRAGVQSVEVAGDLLRVLLDAEGPLRLADLARGAGMPAAKAHRYLVSLARIGLAAQDPASGRYDLGPVALHLGTRAFVRFEPLRAAEIVLRELVDEVGETAALAVWGVGGPSIVRVVEARHDLAGSVALSHRCPLTWSATGLVFCAFEDPVRTDGPIERDLEQNRRVDRRSAPHDRIALGALVDEVRREGMARMTDGGGEGRAALAAPVFDAEGRVAMALTVFGRFGRLDAAPNSGIARCVSAATRRLSAAFGRLAAP